MSVRLVPLSGRHVPGLTALAGDDTITPWTATPTVSPGQSYWIGRAQWGQGYATAAARQLVSHGFGRMGLTVVFARCPSADRASARVVEKLGFRFIGLEPSLGDPQSGDETIRHYDMTRDEWLER